ncbi:MAG TPA: Wzy polymerase domain-containing protein [Burkholderiales bacterium]|nr:Wzy polymerase domain-containing protein [Burkholderiales bacterium]
MSATRSEAISLLLAGSICLLPFLIPYHQQPVLSFYPEWLAAALGTAAVLAALAGRRPPAVSWPAAARWLIAFMLFLAMQTAIGTAVYPQSPLLAALYVLYAILMLWLGAQLASAHGIDRTAAVLAAFLLAGALANAGSGILQFYARPAPLEDFIAELRGSRAYGNIAQPNLYADYLALGQGALVFLWLRAHVRSAYALLALALLAVGGALSGSRAIYLYALWFAAFGSWAAFTQEGIETRRLRFAACCVAGAAVAARLAVPWLNSALQLGPLGGGAPDPVLASSGEYFEPRWQVWLLALRVFAAAPLFGAGVGSFAGAASALGLDPSLTRIGEVWTSPHNLLLHLLAETGAVGAILAIGGLCIWGWQAARRFRAAPEPGLWWAIAAAGVTLIHSLVEFPLWSAHFLGVAALLVGASSAPDSRSAGMSGWNRVGAALACVALVAALALLLRDYVRIDTTRVTGTTVTLARPDDARRDAATMRELTHGFMAPVAELQIVMGAALDRNDLPAKLAASERVARYWPSHVVLVRRAVFLALAGETEAAQGLLASALRAFPHQSGSVISILEQALAADKTAIQPLLIAAKGARVRLRIP